MELKSNVFSVQSTSPSPWDLEPDRGVFPNPKRVLLPSILPVRVHGPTHYRLQEFEGKITHPYSTRLRRNTPERRLSLERLLRQ